MELIKNNHKRLGRHLQEYQPSRMAIYAACLRRYHHRWLMEAPARHRNAALAIQVRLGLAEDFDAAQAAFQSEKEGKADAH